jgi:CDP-diglyceride synthetase
MKKIMFISGLALAILFIYLIYVYIIHNEWNKTEQLLLVFGFIISVLLIFIKLFQVLKEKKKLKNQ